jgi:anaerobic selenocysteine-containing dehydrogenase
MTKSTEDKATSRRDFLKIASAAPVAAAAAAAGTEAAADIGSGAGGSGLQDTAHTRAYYQSARF